MHRSSAKDEVGKMHEQKWSSLEWEAKQYPFISNKYRKVANRMHKERVIRDSFYLSSQQYIQVKNIYICNSMVISISRSKRYHRHTPKHASQTNKSLS